MLYIDGCWFSVSFSPSIQLGERCLNLMFLSLITLSIIRFRLTNINKWCFTWVSCYTACCFIQISVSPRWSTLTTRQCPLQRCGCASRALDGPPWSYGRGTAGRERSGMKGLCLLLNVSRSVNHLNSCADSIHQQQYQHQPDSCYNRCFTRNLKCLKAWRTRTIDVWPYSRTAITQQYS